MCLIIVKPSGTTMPPRDHFENAWDSNPHGFGAVMSKYDTATKSYKVQTFRTLKKEEAMGLFDQLKENEDSLKHLAMSFHFRLATHGSKNKNNCHAFTDKESRLGFQHNGIIDIGIPDGCDMTDSESYFNSIVIPLYNHHGKDMDKAIEYLRAINDGYNKLSFIWNNKHYTIGRFTLDNGIYYSNNGYSKSPFSYKQDEKLYRVDLPCATCTSLDCYNCDKF